MKLRLLTVAVIVLLLVNVDISNCQSRSTPSLRKIVTGGSAMVVKGGARTRASAVNDVIMQPDSMVGGMPKEDTGKVKVTAFHGGIPVKKTVEKTVGSTELSSAQGAGIIETSAAQSGGASEGAALASGGSVKKIQSGGTVEAGTTQGVGSVDVTAGVKTADTVSAAGADSVTFAGGHRTPIVKGSQTVEMGGGQAGAQDIFGDQSANTEVAADPFLSEQTVTDPFVNDPFSDPFADPAATVDSVDPAVGSIDPFAVDMFDVTEATPTKPHVPPPINGTTQAPATIAPESLLPALLPDGRFCNETYKPHPTKKHWFSQQLPDGQWEDMMCPPDTGEVWREDLCRCDVELQEIIYVEPEKVNSCPGYYPHRNPHKYLQEVNGANLTGSCAGNLVWKQNICNCDYGNAPARSMAADKGPRCTVILNMSMEDNLHNDAAYYDVREYDEGKRGRISKLTFDHIPGSDGMAAEIRNQPLVFQAFHSNDFQKTLAFALDFKILKTRQNSRRYMVLFSNGCLSSGNRKRIRGHSVKLSFQPSKRKFKVDFKTTGGPKIGEAKAKPDAEGWYRTVLYFEDATINLEVNGQKIATIPGVNGTIPANQCPLYIAGQQVGDKKKESNFYGYLENFIVFKDCGYHDSNLKIL